MSTSLPAPVAAVLLAGLPGAFLAHGATPGGDLDAAFDDAVDAAGYDYGFAGLLPSVADVDAATLRPLETTPVPLARACLIAVRALHAAPSEPGVTHAIPVCADASYRRRRVRLTLTDPALVVGEAAGPLGHVSAELEALLRTGETGDLLADTEVLESVEVVTARHRYRPRVSAFKGSPAATFAVLDPTRGVLVSSGHRTAGDARRAAVEAAKAGPIGQDPIGFLEVVKVTRRADGSPLLRVDRDRVASRQVLKVTVSAVKDPAKVKPSGWLFYGTRS